MLRHSPRRRRWPGALAWLLAGTLCSAAWASDHRDTAALDVEASVDIADVFAWTALEPTPEPEEALDAGDAADAGDPIDAGAFEPRRMVYLAMTLRGRPVPGAQYVFHLESRPEFSQDGLLAHALCTFDDALIVQCWLREDADYVTGDASEGLEGLNLKVWTGFIDDPTFADATKVEQLALRLGQARTSTTAPPTAAGCPTVDAPALLSELATDSTDSFAGERVFVLMLRAAPEVIAPDGPLLGVWASSREAGASP